MEKLKKPLTTRDWIRAELENLAEQIETRVRADVLRDVSARFLGNVEIAQRSADELIKESVGRLRKKVEGSRRDPKALERMERRILRVLTSPLGAKELAECLGVSTRTLALPIQKLLASGEISKEGVKRATRYFVP